MSALHSAASSPKARELVDVVLAEFDQWSDHAANQAAAIWPDKGEACHAAVAGLREDLADHLVIAIGITLASWGES